MRRDDQRRVRKYPIEDLSVVNQHIADRRAHEYLDAAGLGRRQATDFFQIVVRGAQVKREIRAGTPCPGALSEIPNEPQAVGRPGTIKRE